MSLQLLNRTTKLIGSIFVDSVHKFASTVWTIYSQNADAFALKLLWYRFLKLYYKMWLQICASNQMMLEIVMLPLSSGTTTAETESANSSSTVAVTEMETASVQDKSVKLDVATFKVIIFIYFICLSTFFFFNFKVNCIVVINSNVHEWNSVISLKVYISFDILKAHNTIRNNGIKLMIHTSFINN